MREARPDTDGPAEPGGTPSPGPADLIDKPLTPGTDDDGRPTPTPGVHEADENHQQHGKAVKPGN